MSQRAGRIRVLVVASAALAGFAVAAPGASAHTVAQKKPIGPAVTLKFETYDTTTDPATLWSENFAKKVAKDTGGAVQIQVYANGELVSQTGAATALETNSIPIGLIALNSIAPTSPAETGIDLEDDPFETPSFKAAKAAMQSLKVRGILNSALSKVNLSILASCIQGNNAIVSSIPMPDLASMAGQKIGVSNTTSAAAISAVGGSPVVIPIGNIYQAFLLHTVTGKLSNVNNDYGYDWYQVAKYIELVGFQWVDNNIVINTQALASMNKAEQKIVRTDALASAPACDFAEQKYNLTVEHAMQQEGAIVVPFSSKAAQKAFFNSFNALRTQENNQSPVSQALSRVFNQISKQYPQ